MRILCIAKDCKGFSNFFNQKNNSVFVILPFEILMSESLTSESLTNNIVNFEQLGPDEARQ